MNSDKEIIYVGRTDGEYLSNRLLTHSHLPDEAYRKKKKVEFIEMEEKSDQVIYEIYFINKFKPKYNSSNKFDGEMTIRLPEYEWVDLNKAKRRSVGNQCDVTKKYNITKAKNRISSFSREIKLCEDCEIFIDEMIRFFGIKQTLITNENVEILENDTNTKNQEVVLYEFKATKECVEVVLSNMTIAVHECATINYKSWIKIVSGATMRKIQDEDKRQCKISLYRCLLPYLHYGYDNLERKIEAAKAKIEIEKIKLEELLIN